jgi:hypothetical protein
VALILKVTSSDTQACVSIKHLRKEKHLRSSGDALPTDDVSLPNVISQIISPDVGLDLRCLECDLGLSECSLDEFKVFDLT